MYIPLLIFLLNRISLEYGSEVLVPMVIYTIASRCGMLLGVILYSIEKYRCKLIKDKVKIFHILFWVVFTFYYACIMLRSFIIGLLAGAVVGYLVQYLTAFSNLTSQSKEDEKKERNISIWVILSLYATAISGYLYTGISCISSLMILSGSLGYIKSLQKILKKNNHSKQDIHNSESIKKLNLSTIEKLLHNNKEKTLYLFVANLIFSASAHIVFPYIPILFKESNYGDLSYILSTIASIILSMVLQTYTKHLTSFKHVLIGMFSSSILLTITIGMFSLQTSNPFWLIITNTLTIITYGYCIRYRNNMENIIIEPINTLFYNFVIYSGYLSGCIIGTAIGGFCLINHMQTISLYIAILGIFISIFSFSIPFMMNFPELSEGTYTKSTVSNSKNKKTTYLLAAMYTLFYSGFSMFKVLYMFWLENNGRLFYFLLDYLGMLITITLLHFHTSRIPPVISNTYNSITASCALLGLAIFMSPFSLKPYIAVLIGLISGLALHIHNVGFLRLSQNFLFNSIYNTSSRFYINTGKFIGPVVGAILLYNSIENNHFILLSIFIAGTFVMLCWIPICISNSENSEYILKSFDTVSIQTMIGEEQQTSSNSQPLQEIKFLFRHHIREVFLMGSMNFFHGYLLNFTLVFAPIWLYRNGISIHTLMLGFSCSFIANGSVQGTMARYCKANRTIYCYIANKTIFMVAVYFSNYLFEYSFILLSVFLFFIGYGMADYYRSSISILFAPTKYYQTYSNYQNICAMFGSLGGIASASSVLLFQSRDLAINILICTVICDVSINTYLYVKAIQARKLKEDKVDQDVFLK